MLSLYRISRRQEFACLGWDRPVGDRPPLPNRYRPAPESLSNRILGGFYNLSSLPNKEAINLAPLSMSNSPRSTSLLKAATTSGQN